MKCPKCAHEMDRVEFGQVEVERCTLCKGLWFDRAEREQLKRLEGSEGLDSGDPGVGKIFDEEERARCPVCDVAMIRMTDPDQPHIHFEVCGVCHGAFFDAGEFTDYKFRTLADLLKGLRARRRE